MPKTKKSPESEVLARIKQTFSDLKKVPARTGKSVKKTVTSVKKSVRKTRAERKKLPRYASFRLQKPIKPDFQPLPSVGELITDTFKFLWRNKKIFIGLFIIHCLVYYVIVRAPVQPAVGNIQKAISDTVQQNNLSINSVQTNAVTIGAVIRTSGSTQQNAVVTITVLFIMSLAYIWALRQLHNNNKIKVRDALYQGMTPAIPTGVVTALVILELLPFAFMSFVYTLARIGGVFVTGFEDLAFFTVTMLLGVLTFYWMTSGIIAIYMAALPGVYPFYALHSAKKLVHFRRTQVFRRIIALPVLLAFLYLVMLLVSISLVPSKTFIIAEVFQLLLVPIVHTYLYKLYRSML